MTIEVYQRKQLADRDLSFAFDYARGEKLVELVKANTESYEEVAVVFADNLEYAYRMTNSIDERWYESDDIDIVVAECAKYGCRSTSIGDFLKVNDDYYVVDSCGFTKFEI